MKKNIALSHLEGLESIYKLRKIYELEIECICLNSNFQDISKIIFKALSLKNNYSEIVVFKESEEHDSNYPYYELSLFCNKKELNEFKKTIKDFGLEVDIVHETKDQWIP